MAIGWLTALKLVPWADVIEAAPGLAKSARGLFKRTQEAAPATTDAVAPSAHGSDADALVQAMQRIAALDALLVQAIERQQAAAELLDKLASQNARMVEAIDTLGRRYQSLKTGLIVVSVVAIAALVWVASVARAG